jgi:twitching motility protein PilT
MQTFNQSLASLYTRKLITLEEALSRSSDPDELRNVLTTGQAGAAPPRPAASR